MSIVLEPQDVPHVIYSARGTYHQDQHEGGGQDERKSKRRWGSGCTENINDPTVCFDFIRKLRSALIFINPQLPFLGQCSRTGSGAFQRMV